MRVGRDAGCCLLIGFSYFRMEVEGCRKQIVFLYTHRSLLDEIIFLVEHSQSSDVVHPTAFCSTQFCIKAFPLFSVSVVLKLFVLLHLGNSIDTMIRSKEEFIALLRTKGEYLSYRSTNSLRIKQFSKDFLQEDFASSWKDVKSRDCFVS